jgi:hypothetical protein
MNAHLADELATLGQLTVSRLRARYAELFDQPNRRPRPERRDVGQRERSNTVLRVMAPA